MTLRRRLAAGDQALGRLPVATFHPGQVRLGYPGLWLCTPVSQALPSPLCPLPEATSLIPRAVLSARRSRGRREGYYVSSSIRCDRDLSIRVYTYIRVRRLLASSSFRKPESLAGGLLELRMAAVCITVSVRRGPRNECEEGT